MTILGIMFIILKINDVIDWNWFIVLSPLFVSVLLSAIQQTLVQIVKSFPDEVKKGIMKSK